MACTLVCVLGLVLSSCTGRSNARLLTRGAPVPTTDVTPVPLDSPETPADLAVPVDNDPTPVLVRPRPTGAASRSSGGGSVRPAAPVARPAPPRPVPVANLAPPGRPPYVWAVVI